MTHALEAACFVPHHDAAMKSLLAVDIQKRASAFDRLRREYPSRRDFHAWAIDCREPGSRDMLLKLGFCVDTTE
ncbi:MAG: DUF3410 domain-containing protein [Gammaproteobacteria bacterium]|nr:DUF3410 domain-containing protein [Gammaproteobacteria bacterium]